MVRRFTPHARPAIHEKQYVDTLSRSQKFDFFTKAINISHGRCMGFAVTMHRGCLKQVANHRWTTTMEDLIETAEDCTLQPGEDLEEVCIDLAARMSCHHHNTQERSQLAMLKAINVYRRTFAMNEPIQIIQPQHHDHSEDLVSNHSRSQADHSPGNRDEHLEPTARLNKSVKSENNHDSDLDAALAKALDSHLEARISPASSSRAQGIDHALQEIREQQRAFEAHINEQFVKLSYLLQHRQELQQVHKVVPKKEKSVPAVPGNMATILSQFALFLQQQNLVADGDESE